MAQVGSNLRADSRGDHARNYECTSFASSLGSKRSLRPGWQYFHRRARWCGWLGFLTAIRLLFGAAFCTPHELRRTVDPRQFDRP